MSRLPETGPSLQRHLRQQARAAQRQAQSSAFARSGTSATAEDEFTVAGKLIVTGPMEVGGTLGVTGPATFSGTTSIGGNASITGTLSLPAGIINNAALANQVLSAVTPAVITTGWSTTTSLVTKASATITVPAGFTSALVTALGTVVFQHDGAGTRFDCRTVIEGTAGPTIMNLAMPTGNTSPSQTRVVPVTGGQVLNIDVQVLSAVASAVMGGNQAVIAASAVFLR